jgi:hypothetical protein
MKTLYRIGFVFLLFPAILVFCGCGDDRAPAKVAGTITLDGKPVANATVTFAPNDGGRNSYGYTDSQGRYELRFTGQLKGAVVGTHRVIVQTGESEVSSSSEEGTVAKETIPAKYNSETELTATLKSGNNVVNFELFSN